MPHLVDVTMFWSAQGGGVGRYLRSKQAWLTTRPGWRHTLAVAAARAAPAAPGLVALPAPPLPFSGGYRFPLARAAAGRTLVALQPDLIEAGDPYRLGWAALDAGQQAGVPVLAFAHTDLVALARVYAARLGPAAAALAGRAAAAYLRGLYGRYDAVLAPSAWMAERLAGLGARRIEVQPLGVDCATFSPQRASGAWRARHGIGPHERVALYAGRFAREKNLDVLARAVRQLGAPWRLVALGAGPCPPPADVLCLPHRAHPQHVAEALASADVFVHAGDQETFGLAALEAMACATPVVARRAAGLAEVVDDRVGVAVADGTASAFAAALEHLWTTDRAALGRAGRARALGYAWPRVLAGLEARYQALLSGGARAAAASTQMAHV